MEEKIAHLEFLQGVIKRMSTNSFLLKGWSLALVSALFAFGAKDAQTIFVALALFPIIMLWILDGYYLQQERLFKQLYNEARLSSTSVETFSMDTSSYRDKKLSWSNTMASKTLIIFHGGMMIAVVLVMLGLLLFAQ